MKIKKAVKILQADKPNSNHHLYPLQVLQQIVEKNKDKYILGQVEFDGVKIEGVNLAQVSHAATNLRIEDNWLVADIKVLDTPEGQKLAECVDSCSFRTAGVGTISICGDVVGDDYRVISINATKEPATWKD